MLIYSEHYNTNVNNGGKSNILSFFSPFWKTPLFTGFQALLGVLGDFKMPRQKKSQTQSFLTAEKISRQNVTQLCYWVLHVR